MNSKTTIGVNNKGAKAQRAAGICVYVAVVALFALTGAVAGAAWALLAKRYAYEYLLIVKQVAYDTIWLEPGRVAGRLAWEGMKFGLFAGTLLMAWRALRTSRLPTWSEARWDWVMGIAGAGLGALLGGVLTWAYVRHGGKMLSPEMLSQMGSIYRVQCLVGVEYGAVVGGLVGVVGKMLKLPIKS